MEDNVRKRMYICMRDWVALLYSRKLTEHCKPTIMKKIKSLKKKTLSGHNVYCRGPYNTVLLRSFWRHLLILLLNPINTYHDV